MTVTTVTRWVLVLLVAAGALLAGYFTYLWNQQPVTPQDAAQVLLTTSLPDLQGQQQPIAQWKGQVLIVNFWATWCPPCLKEIPEFIRLQEQYRARGVQFVGIAIDDRGKVAEFADRLGMNYPVLVAELEGIALARKAGNRLGGLPFTVIIDRQGRTSKIELGVLDEKKLLPILGALL
jgi:thiol-disulfide isomerase/thioredoxin